jgi:protein-tyrosine phosphatase
MLVKIGKHRMKILFVCTGNICRSSAAEAVMKHYVKAHGGHLSFLIESAGTHGYHIGEHPDPRGMRAAKDRGISMDGQIARKVGIDDFTNFDMIIAMDEGHYTILQDIMPANTKASLTRFVDYCDIYQGQGVPDPYYGNPQTFEDVLDIIEEGVSGLFRHLKT